MAKLLEPWWRIPILFLLLGSAARCQTAQTVEPESVGLSREKLQAVHNLLVDHVGRKRIAGGVALIAGTASATRFPAFFLLLFHYISEVAFKMVACVI